MLANKVKDGLVTFFSVNTLAAVSAAAPTKLASAEKHMLGSFIVVIIKKLALINLDKDAVYYPKLRSE